MGYVAALWRLVAAGGGGAWRPTTVHGGNVLRFAVAPTGYMQLVGRPCFALVCHAYRPVCLPPERA